MLVYVLLRSTIFFNLCTSLLENVLPMWKVEDKLGSIWIGEEEILVRDENNSM